MVAETNRYPPAEVMRQIEERWISRAKAQGYGGLKHRTYHKHRVEFFAGAINALEAQGMALPTLWVIQLATGSRINDKEPA